MGVMALAVSGWLLVSGAASVELPVLEPTPAQVAAHQARAAWEADEASYLEAETVGVTHAVAASGMTSRQQRSLSIAIVREARRNQLDPLLVVALIRAESSFNNYAVSGVGAMGLMQVMPLTGDYLMFQRGQKLGRKSNLFDHELNVELGTAYLADLIRRFGNVEHALVAYNAGPGAARRILAQPDARKRFLAGYPRKIVTELRRLKARATELASATETSAARGT